MDVVSETGGKVGALCRPGVRAAPSRPRGQALVEMALVAPLLVLILLSIFEFGWYFYALATISNCTRLAARVGSTGKSNGTITDAVNKVKGFVNVTSITVTVATSGGASVDSADRTTGNYISVMVAAPYRPLTGMVDLNRLAGISQIKDRSTFLIVY